MTTKVNVCFITDENYAVPTLVAVQSLIENRAKNTRYRIYIVAVNLTEEQIKKFQKLTNKKCRIYVKETNNIYDNINTSHLYVSKAAMLKFNLPNMFPKLNKLAYIDGDVLILGDLFKLFNTDLNNKYAAVVADIVDVMNGHDTRLGLSNYFNSGVMLLNLKKMRQDDITNKLIKYKKQDKDKFFMDQDAFNAVFNEHVKYLPLKYNMLSVYKKIVESDKLSEFYNLTKQELYQTLNNPIILHMAGNHNKPWESGDAMHRELWKKYYNDMQEKIRRFDTKLERFARFFFRHKVYPNGRHKILLCGIKVFSYKPHFAPDAKIKGNFLFTTEKLPNGRKHVYICGIKIASYKKKKIVTNITQLVTPTPIQQITNVYETPADMFILWHIQRVARLHTETFSRFKNINAGKNVVIICTGPSLNDFNLINDAVYIGVNKAFAYDKVKLDYLFMQDYICSKEYINQSFPYKNKNLVRFYGIEPTGIIEDFVIPESIAIRHNALRYYCHASCSKTPDLPDTFAYDLCSEELYSKGSTVFGAVQFALWTNPKRIYLVGCDCSDAGHFDNTKSVDLKNLIEHWQNLKWFISIYYPETEIISVNPVGLKGLFHDVYTKSYLEKHPEIDAKTVEILE